MAGLLGFEPRLRDSKSPVLPLHYKPSVWGVGRELNPHLPESHSGSLPVEIPTPLNKIARQEWNLFAGPLVAVPVHPYTTS